jgi:hypothetical protein
MAPAAALGGALASRATRPGRLLLARAALLRALTQLLQGNACATAVEQARQAGGRSHNGRGAGDTQ